MKTYLFLFLIFSLLSSFSSAAEEECGWQVCGALCPNALCCSKVGFCGNTEPYCKVPDCQSQCPGGNPPGTVGNLSDIISKSQFEDMLKHRNDPACPAKGFYTYDAFITAAQSFPGFGTTGETSLRKKEVAAFFGQTSHQTRGPHSSQTTVGWATAARPDEPYTGGYCLKEEPNPNNYTCCEPSSTWPCAPGKSYCGRGAIQLSGNNNYGPFGSYIKVDLLNHPELVANDPVIAFKSAIWLWMTTQPPQPSCHAVIACNWIPSDNDVATGRLPGYGVITNIITRGSECGHGENPSGEDRIGFYQRYSKILGVTPGSNLDCYNQSPFVRFFLDAAI